MGIMNLVHKMSNLGGDWITFARIHYTVSTFGLTNTDVNVYQYDLAGQPVEKIESMNEQNVLLFSSYLTLWFCNLWYETSHISECRDIFYNFLKFQSDGDTDYKSTLVRCIFLLEKRVSPERLQNKPYVDFLLNKYTKALKVRAFNLSIMDNSYGQMYLLFLAYNFLQKQCKAADRILQAHLVGVIDVSKNMALLTSPEMAYQIADTVSASIMKLLMAKGASDYV